MMYRSLLSGFRSRYPCKMFNAQTAGCFKIPKRFDGIKESVFDNVGDIMAKDPPDVNLASGYPDFLPAYEVLHDMRTMLEASDEALFQYTNISGCDQLLDAVSKWYSKLLGRNIDRQKEVMIAAGSTKMLFFSVFSNICDKDEVIIIEPFYEAYEPLVRMCGGIPKMISLKMQPNSHNTAMSSGDFVLDPSDLESIFSSSTKMFIFCNPCNPMGKVYTQAELQSIADLCIKYNVICVSDEVYEWMVYEPNKHVRIASLPGMWDRTITISSASKTFRVTGWRVGWAYGPEELIQNMIRIQHHLGFVADTPAQHAIALTIERENDRQTEEDNFIGRELREYEMKRDFLVNVLSEVGMKPVVPEGGMFVAVDLTPIEHRIELQNSADSHEKGWKFFFWMLKELKISSVPLSAFYCEQHRHGSENWIRLCFARKQETLDLAAQILRDWACSSNDKRKMIDHTRR